MTNTNYYPPSPTQDVSKLTKTGGAYMARVIAVLAGLALFLLIYLAMIAAAAGLVYLAVIWPMYDINKLTLFLKLGSIAMTGMLFAFTLKFLFKSYSTDDKRNIELKKSEHPHLFEFIEKLAKETGAPKPKKVVVNPDINAAVYYNSTILSLFLPVRKNLLIGLGLVNSVNLTEFKAVLAHEFGHFAQRSMKLGSYVYMANRIIYGMVYERDSWDEMLDNWMASDFRLAVFAWIIMPIVLLVRGILKLVYQGINLLNSSLSRQMEFNADRVAVSVTGSNAIINGLYKLDAASQAQNLAFQHLSHATDHQLFTDNLFFHQREAFTHLKNTNPDFEEALFENQKVENHQAAFLFNDEWETIPEMYASHPSNFKREKNTKKIFIEGIEDDRSPWVLFNDPDAVAKKVTRRLYNLSFQLKKDQKFTPAVEVQKFIEAELAETTYDARYQGMYDDRFLNPVEIDKASALVEELELSTETLQLAFEELYGKPLKTKMDELKQRGKDLNLLAMILNKQDKRKEFQIAGKKYAASQAEKVYTDLSGKFEQDQPYFVDFDKKAFAIHYAMQKEMGQPSDDLLFRYRFHYLFQEKLKYVMNLQQELHAIVNSLMAAKNIDEDEAKGYAKNFNGISKKIVTVLKTLNSLKMPEFSNLAEIKSLRNFILEGELIALPATFISGDHLNGFMQQIDTILTRSRRIYFKSLGGILAIQEEVSKGYFEQKEN